MSREKFYAAVLVALGVAMTARADSTPDEATQAIWRVQRLELDYHSSSASYSCDGLEEKIRSILQAVGAHESLAVKTRCDGRGPVSFARVLITLASPVEATPENIRAATTFEPHERMVAQLKHVVLPTSADIERFAASWQHISLRPHVATGDCDLLDDLRGQILPKLRIRATRGFNCSVSASRLRPAPRVEALVRSDRPPR
jgi:hypothetical protein